MLFWYWSGPVFRRSSIPNARVRVRVSRVTFGVCGVGVRDSFKDDMQRFFTKLMKSSF